MMVTSRTISLASQRVMLCAILLVALVLGVGYQARAAEPSNDARQTVDQLLRLVHERLAIAPDVAKAKWNSGDPIDAPAREAQILERVVAEATRAGIDEAFAQTFFKHQFEASKVIQHRLHEQWRQTEQPPFESPPDLAEDIRPQLDQLTPQLMASLRDFQRVAESEGVRQYLENNAETLVNDGVGGVAREEALRPLYEATDTANVDVQ
ncbi:gamma subclass chorismate mutase AroQ [Halomonas sp. KHS3]|uniref:gamma subclass chorismate mutase AroQ n=2 Tax=Oceanospirillales TaxID=135619 RepID=UPI00047FF85F|nr:gamma subclass chorismate mutase AroQ [Halomonas sp. KHS3]KIN15872.1 chorismate mutase [Halomonas sp. KHS3]NAO96231.1 gamma subclass chorismate mutase AroQ [Halomonas sp. MG34]PKH58668.1 chorismate mutase AroQ, gamma subclass [Halomonas sp. Choline-3u-9]QGQ69538.1 gamma subclass chorismate mutase AroQ [Halomonas sp. PA16-9]